MSYMKADFVSCKMQSVELLSRDLLSILPPMKTFLCCPRVQICTVGVDADT